MPTKNTITTKKKMSVTVQAAMITTIGTVLVALITGLFSWAQKNSTPQSSADTSTFLSSGTVSPTSTFTPSAPQNIKVLIDYRHMPDCSCYDLSLLNIDGVTITKSSTDAFTLDTLKPYDVVILIFAGYESSLQDNYLVQEFTPNEILAIQDYLEQGGGVFMASPSWIWKAYDKKTADDFPLNLIAESYGITFSTSSVDDCNKDGKKVVITDSLFSSQNPITKDIYSIASTDDAAPAFLTIEEPALRIASCSIATKPVLAYSQAGKGRIVALTHPDFAFKNLNDPNYDNYKLLKNILAWLASD